MAVANREFPVESISREFRVCRELVQIGLADFTGEANYQAYRSAPAAQRLQRFQKKTRNPLHGSELRVRAGYTSETTAWDARAGNRPARPGRVYRLACSFLIIASYS